VETIPVAGTSGWKVSNDRLSFVVLSVGATIHSLSVPDRTGKLNDVVLGFADAEDYKKQGPYFGAIVGRVANRMSTGKFEIDGKQYQVSLNDGQNSLHGGVEGFDKKTWTVEEASDGVVLTLESKDGQEGYPGNVKIRAHYSLKGATLTVKMTAKTDAPTPVSLAQHTYFNLAGHASGSVLGAKLRVEATGYMPVDSSSIPTRQVVPLSEHPHMDFSDTHSVGDKMNDMAKKRGLDVVYDPETCTIKKHLVTGEGEEAAKGPGGAASGAPLGFDHNYVLKKPSLFLRLLAALSRGFLRPVRKVATVTDPTSGTQMQVMSDAPGVQLYTGNFLNGERGKGGVIYEQHGGLCLETQTFPDSVGADPASDIGKGATAILQPGQTYRHVVMYKFGTVDSDK